MRLENTWQEIRDHPSSRITPDLQIHSFFSSVHSLIFYRVQVREHLTQDQRSFLHPESLQIFRFTASSLQFTHSSSTGFRSENTWQEIRDHPSSRITPDLQIHSFFSSVHSSSTGFRSENTWHEIRDHSFIQNHSRSSDSQLLLFSSRTHLLQGSDQRTPDPRSETIPSSRITPDPSDSQLLLFSSRTHLLQGSGQRTPDTRSETIPSSRITPDLQIHIFFSSVHLTHLLQGSGQRTPDTRSETIPSSRITPDLQIHSFSSSVHSLIFYRVQNREHLTRDQRPFLHPESLQIFRFTASSLQFTHSSSTGFRSENTWHEIRDHSFIQNHSRSSDSQLLLFSSLTHLLQGSEQRTPDTRSETIPSSRITPDLQIHSFSSSVHLTHLLQGSGQRTPDTRSETIPSSRITPDLQIHSFFSSVHSLIFYRVQVREHLTRDKRPFLHPESLQIFRFTASSLQFTSLIFYRVQIREHLTRDQRPFLHPESLQIFRFTASSLQFTSLIFYRVQVREHLTRDQRPFLHPESLQIFRFTASPLQFTHSSSTGFRTENTWHEIRDHSFIQNHSRSSDSQLLLFSSPHSSSTGSRSENTWHEIRDHSFIQNHSRSSDSQLLLFSSPHPSSTGFRSENTWHEIRDHSFIQNHSRSSDSQLLLFSSPHSSSTGFRSENTWHEIRDHSFIQNHSRSSDSHLLLFSSPHSSSTGFRSENTWPEIRDRSFIQNHSRSSDSQLLLFSSPHSSSTGFRSENTWHEIRDHSFIQNHSRSSDSQLLLFSSLTHLLQGSEQRTPDTRSETVPSSRITPDPSDSQLLLFSSLTHLLQGSDQRTPDTRSETVPSSRITPDLQIHSFFSSVHSLIFYRVQNREHLTRDQRPFLHPESLQIFRFTASSLQFTHSSSTGFRSENTWHEIRDRSFIQNHSRSSDSQLLRFSSLTHLLQGSGQRTPDTRSETIPSSRITPDLQIHSFFSSVHSLIFYRVQVREHLTRDQRPFLHPESLQIFRFTASSLQFTSLIFYRVQIREHLTRDQRPFLHPESLQIFRFTASSLQFTSLIFYRVQVREHLTRDQRPFLHPESLQIFRFTASPLQFTHSSSTGFRTENTWHEIRDHSFIQNHSRSSDSQLLLFSSLTHLLQGPGQRTPDTRSETIPSSRITPDLQIHIFFSSVHLTHLLQGSDQRTPDTRSETFLHPESLQIFRFTASSLQFTHSSSTGFRTENTWHEIRDHSFIQNHSRSSDSHLLLFSSPHSSSTGFRSENTWPEIRDHSFIQNHSRSSDSQLLLFSSLTHLLQGSEQRTPDTRSETVPSSRITPDLQIHSFFSSVHSLIFYRVQNREHLTRDQRPFLHPESLQIFRFTASSLQFTHSSSTGFRSENTWHEIRDRSFIQNHSRSSDSQLLRFSSLTHLLQGSGQRTPDTRSETVPSSRITPDLQIHSFFSSVHLTHLLQGSGQRTEWPAEAWFCAQWPIFVLFLRFVFGLFYMWKIQTWFIIIFLTESVTCWFFYLLVFDRIHDAMRLTRYPGPPAEI